MQKKVLLAFDDPGGGLVVSALIRRLAKEKNLNFIIYAGKFSERFLEERKINFNKINSKISNQEAKRIIDKELPDLIVTGTGAGNAEQELRNIAYQRNIKSIVILDFWKDYSRRWLYADYPLEKMKDKICVMDELTKKEMIDENFPEKNLMITGHPYLDEIFNYNESDLNLSNEKAVSENNNYLFLSQPLHVLGIKDYEVHPLESLLEAINKLSKDKREKFSLFIKFHPSEEETEELSSLVRDYDSEDLWVEFADRSKQLNELLNQSGTVIGYNTIAMFESRALNKRTVSISAGPVKDSLLNAMNEAGIEIVSSDRDKIYECLAKKNKPDPVRRNNLFKGGIENCVNIIINELNLN